MREELNPYAWRARHRLALFIACGAGAAIGLIPGYKGARPPVGGPAILGGPYDCQALLNDTWAALLETWRGYISGAECAASDDLGGRWVALLGWPLFTALLAGAVIVVWRLMTTPPLGHPGNPVIGGLAPSGQKWQIVDSWPPSRKTGTSQKMGLEVSPPLSSSSPDDGLGSVGKPLGNGHTEGPGE